eukprot:Seg2712.1 transcript_id=Seg2712.1/GoldUCD/mRNA.D3Y31 product="Gamma-aminobutyric acid receptor subunit beta-4" protein_id=Seg2712.1/GoldUCD/D3Y31
MSHNSFFKIFCGLFLIGIQSYNALLMKDSVCSNGGHNVDGEIIDGLLKNHDKRIRPNAHNVPTVVTVSIKFVKLSDINPVGHFYAEFFIFMEWMDPRICYNKTYVITLQGNEGSSFWHPDVYFSNALKATTHTVTEKNSHLNLHPNGSLFATLRVTVQADCPQDLTRFPFDVQVCKLKIASLPAIAMSQILYANERVELREVIYKWDNQRDGFSC